MKKSTVLFLILTFLSGGCTTFSSEARGTKADDIARQGGLQKSLIKAEPFVLTAYARLAQPGEPLHVYIEGDGYAWVTRTRVSGDPTPRDPLGLRLAAEDLAPNVVYLARPCQYTPEERNPSCEEFYWTGGRFSEEAVSSMNKAVSSFVEKAKAPGVDLIGYSGGAAVAILVAARRQDVRSLRTVAGNLDPEIVNQHHGVSPLNGSLDPGTVAAQIASIPQLHFVGGDDETIPYEALSAFLKKMGDGRCFQSKTLPDASHHDGWVESWSQLLEVPVGCHEAS